MKKVIAVLLLIMSSAFAQHRMEESKQLVPTVRYEWIAADCSAYPNWLDQLSSQCFFARLRVIAHSYRAAGGFYIVVSYTDPNFLRPVVWSEFTMTRAANGDFVQDFIIPQGLVKISALELIAGGLVYPQ